MKALVTGATGFLGGALARRLHTMGIDVTATGRNEAIGQCLQREGIRFISADLTDVKGMSALCKNQTIVFHCGALSSPWGPYQNFYSANVIGTQHVIQGCLEHHVDRLVYVSTPSLYFAYRPRLNVRETDPWPAKPVNAYVHTKRLAEQAIDHAHREGLPVITLRPRAIFGPGDNSILPRVIRALQQGRLPLIGDGSNLADLTYIDNAVDALVLCMNSAQSTLGKKYNITDGEPVRLWEMIAKLCDHLGYPQPRKQVPYRIAFWLTGTMEWVYKIFLPTKEPMLTRYTVSVLATSQTLDIQAAQQELGYLSKVSTEEGLQRFVRWWKEHHP